MRPSSYRTSTFCESAKLLSGRARHASSVSDHTRNRSSARCCLMPVFVFEPQIYLDFCLKYMNGSDNCRSPKLPLCECAERGG